MSNNHPVTTATPQQGTQKRAPLTIASITLVLVKNGLGELFDVRQVPNRRNFVIAPLLQANERTPWSTLSDWERHQKIGELIQALDNAGYGYPEEVQKDGTTLPAGSVGEGLRYSQPQTRVFAPRLYVNAQRLDRETARAVALVRRGLLEGSPEQREKIRAMAAALTAEAEAETEEPVEDDSAI